MNAGLDQTAWADLTPAESSSPQLRWQGSARCSSRPRTSRRRTTTTSAPSRSPMGSGCCTTTTGAMRPTWSHPGALDPFRLPKFSYHFFPSQRPPANGPMVFIACNWMPGSTAAGRGPNGTRMALRGESPRFELVYTTDGTEPGPGSPRYPARSSRVPAYALGWWCRGRSWPRWPRRSPGSVSPRPPHRRSGSRFIVEPGVPYPALPATASPGRTRGAPAPTTDSR